MMMKLKTKQNKVMPKQHKQGNFCWGSELKNNVN